MTPETGPLLYAPDLEPEAFAPFAYLLDSLGFVPRLFAGQTLRPDVVEAEVGLLRTVLLTQGALGRVRKELIFLAVAGASGNAALAAGSAQVLRTLGVSEEVCAVVAGGLEAVDLSDADRALLAFTRRLALLPRRFGASDLEKLRGLGFDDAEILEAVVATALCLLFDVIQRGLATAPDFPVDESLLPMNPSPDANRLSEEGEPFESSPQTVAAARDADLVARARGGNVDAFEELVKLNEQRVLRVLRGITGSLEDAEDCAQRVFLKAYGRLSAFREASSFSTWLTRIAINEGIERVRSRKPAESLDAVDRESEEAFRPRQLTAWTEDPETAYARAELKDLIEREMARLPERYRLAVMLRDVEQMSTTEAAAALGLPVATLKTHLLRGRLMLREALAPRLSGRWEAAGHA